MRSNIRKYVHQIDQFFLNFLLPKRTFYIDLNKCIDEFGNSFGKNGNHFFVKVLNKSNFLQQKKVIQNHYKINKIKNVNKILNKDINNVYGNFYFCPWEKGRLRKIEVFYKSHKIGPTNSSDIEKIINRLNVIKTSIQKRGFKQYSKLNGFVRIINVIDRKNNEIHMIRDGQHRCAILSYLGRKKIRAIYESDYWTQSPILRTLKKLIYFCFNKKLEKIDLPIKEININSINKWPYVKYKILNPKDAELFFNIKFSKFFEVIKKQCF